MTHASFLRRRRSGGAIAVDVTAPTLTSAIVADATPTRVTLTWSEGMNSDISAAAAFTVSGHTVSGHTYVDSTHSYLTVDAFVNGETARTLAYTAPGSSKMRDDAGNLVANFTGTAITNNVAPASAVDYWTELGYGAVPADRVDVNGRIVLQKHASAPIIFVDPDAGNNSWDGLYGVQQGASTNGPKLTLFAALQTAAAHANFGAWVLIKAGSDIGTSFTTLLQTPQGVDEQYPALISTYDQGSGAADDVTWRNTALYRTGVWHFTANQGMTFNATQNPSGRRQHKWLVIENMRCTISTQSTSGTFQLAGSASRVLFENCIWKMRQVYMLVSLYNKLLADQSLVHEHVHARHCGFWKGVNQGIFTEKGADFSMDLCVMHSCGYSGTNRSDGGQVRPPSVTEHNAYAYAENFRATRTIFSDGANFGVSARRGAEIEQCLFVNNGGHIIIAGAATDSNDAFPGVSAVIRDCVMSGMNYINGVNTSGGANGVGIALSRIDGSSNFDVSRNIMTDFAAVISPYSTSTLIASASTSTAAHIANHRFVTFTTSTGTLTSAATTMTNSTRSNTAALIWEYASGIQMRFNNSTDASSWQVGDSVSVSGWTGTVATITSDTFKQFDGSVDKFEYNIMRNCGAQPWLQQITDEDSGALAPAITAFNCEFNVYDQATDATGTNVTYASVSGTYLDPTRTAETYASTLGYGSSKAWLDVAVMDPTTEHCVPALNWIRAGFNMSAL